MKITYPLEQTINTGKEAAAFLRSICKTCPFDDRNSPECREEVRCNKVAKQVADCFRGLDGDRYFRLFKAGTTSDIGSYVTACMTDAPEDVIQKQMQANEQAYSQKGYVEDPFGLLREGIFTVRPVILYSEDVAADLTWIGFGS